MPKYKIKCTVFVEVEADLAGGLRPEFYFEENGCPGTGAVGSAIDDAIRHGDDAGVCWACNLHGTNEVIEVDGKPFQRSPEG